MKFILAKKEEMTRVFAKDGRAHAGTILSTDSVVVTQVKTKDGKDKYAAVQVGFGTRKAKNVGKAVFGHTKERAMRRFANSDSEDATEIGGNEIRRGYFFCRRCRACFGPHEG